MIQRSIALALALALAVSSASCVHAPPPQAPAAMPQEYQSMVNAMLAAQTGASRPGDDDLTCEQLQEEFSATTADPELHEHAQAAGAEAQKDVASVEQAQAEIASQTATTVVGSLVPGASMGAMAATAANAEAATTRGAQRMQSRTAQAGHIVAMMPTLMRGERIMQLAAAKGLRVGRGPRRCGRYDKTGGITHARSRRAEDRSAGRCHLRAGRGCRPVSAWRVHVGGRRRRHVVPDTD